MSPLGQTRKSGDAITTSALPPTADTPESGCDVRKVPEPGMTDNNGAGRRRGLVTTIGTANQLDTRQYKQCAQHDESELLLRCDRKGAEHRAERERAGVPDAKRWRRPEAQETQTCTDQCGA
jgi:hypothetical protein